MNPLEQLDQQVGSHLQAQGGILDRLNYLHLRRLGVQLRDIPQPRDDWDLPPASLQGWVGSYAATIESVKAASECGLLDLLGQHADEIRTALDLGALPWVDADVVAKPALEQIVAHAKMAKSLDVARLRSQWPSSTEVARGMYVVIGESIRWDERPKIDKKKGLKRLKIAAIIGKVATGGALAVANLSLGVLGGLSFVPGISGASIPVAAGLLTSTYTGFSAAFDGLEKLSSALEE